MKIQISKTKSIEWTPPWEKANAEVTDVVGIEVASGNPAGAPAVRIQRRKGVLQLACVGFVPEPEGQLPSSWDELGNQPKWSLPSDFRADHAAITINSADAATRQTAIAPFLEDPAKHPMGIATSKDGTRTTICKMADESAVIQASIPEYQALWLNRLLPEGRRPTAFSLQTTVCSLLASLTAQPGFCEEGDEMAVFVTQASISIAGFRNGIPLLFRDCPGIAGAAAMREAIKSALGIDDAMLDTVFASNGIIDTGPALNPILAPVLAQIEISVDYLKSRLASDPKRIFVMGDAAGSAALKRVLEGRVTLPLATPNIFDGLELPAKSTVWKDRYCVGEVPPIFLAALGAALATLGEKVK